MSFNPEDNYTRWADIGEFPNYQISDKGDIWNKKRNRAVAVSMDRAGLYKHVTLWKNNRCFGAYIHRLVAQAFIPNPEHKPQVNHIDGDKLNNHVSNLEWVTAKENNVHAVAKLNRPSATGERHGMTTLTSEQVAEIREKYATGNYYHRQLADQYGVTRSTITNIVNRKTWSK